MTECLDQRRPRADRIKQAVWRGSTNDHHLGSWLSTAEWHKNIRVQLALRAENMSDIADFGLTHLFIGALEHAESRSASSRQVQMSWDSLVPMKGHA